MNLFNTKPDNQTTVKNHLGYCGYNISDSEAGNLICDKGYGPAMLVHCQNNEVMLYGRYQLNQIAQNNLSELLGYVNSLNESAMVVTCTINQKDNFIEFRALYQGDYTKKSFGRFIQYWENDVLYNIDNHPNTNYFLGNDQLDTSLK